MAKSSVGFYKLIADDEHKRLMGALLMTDELGKPTEFRVTRPVKPTLIQRHLYGDALFPHVGVELCGLPLFQALKGKPALLVVSHSALLPLGDTVESTVVHLERTGSSLVIKGEGDNQRGTPDKVVSRSGRFEPLSVSCPDTYDTSQHGNALKLVEDFFRAIDLLEPFGRIDVAVRMLQEQDERFR